MYPQRNPVQTPEIATPGVLLHMKTSRVVSFKNNRAWSSASCLVKILRKWSPAFCRQLSSPSSSDCHALAGGKRQLLNAVQSLLKAFEHSSSLYCRRSSLCIFHSRFHASRRWAVGPLLACVLSCFNSSELEDPPQAAAPTTEGSTAEEGSEASTAGAGSGGWGWNSGWSGWSGQQWSWRQPYC